VRSAAEQQRLTKLNLLMRQPADRFPSAAFARPSYLEQRTDAGTMKILAFDGATTHAFAETANPQFEDKSRAHNVGAKGRIWRSQRRPT